MFGLRDALGTQWWSALLAARRVRDDGFPSIIAIVELIIGASSGDGIDLLVSSNQEVSYFRLFEYQ